MGTPPIKAANVVPFQSRESTLVCGVEYVSSCVQIRRQWLTGLPDSSMAQRQLEAAAVLSTASAQTFALKAFKEHSQIRPFFPSLLGHPTSEAHPCEPTAASLPALSMYSPLPTSSLDPRARRTLVMMPLVLFQAVALGLSLASSPLDLQGSVKPHRFTLDICREAREAHHLVG